MNNDFKLTAEAQEFFGENPAVLRIIDRRGNYECRVAPVGVNGPILTEAFYVDRDDLEPIRPR